MLPIPKRYRRFISYLTIIGSIFIVLHYLNTKSKPNRIIIQNESLTTEARILLNEENLPNVDPNDHLVVNIGKLRCLHIGTIFETCKVIHMFRDESTTTSNFERIVIKKDIRGSVGFHWVGTSEYLFYDVMTITSLLLTENRPSMTAISLIYEHDKNPIRGQLSGKFDGNIYIKLLPVDISSLKQPGTFITDLTLLFGSDCVDPRPGWVLNKNWTYSEYRFPSYLSTRLYNNANPRQARPTLKEDSSGKFKIVQLADLHMGVGINKCEDEFPKHEHCEADPKTIEFVKKVLELEDPQLVVFTGDQIMGDRSIQDSETTLLKAIAPVVKRKIPWAMVWGNHDDEGSLTRWELSELATNLPYSLFQIGTKDTKNNLFGVGNYYIQAQANDSDDLIATFYFLDSHKYSKTKISPGYDWIKESQWDYFEDLYNNKLKLSIQSSHKLHVSMAFFHIPLPEYLNLDSKRRPNEQNQIVGTFKEGVTAPRYNSGGLNVLQKLGVSVTSCGHDHCNDYCLQDDSTPS